jgi:peroxiredoxin
MLKKKIKKLLASVILIFNILISTFSSSAQSSGIYKLDQAHYNPNQVAINTTDKSVYNHLDQWGRNSDAHEKHSSAITSNKSSSQEISGTLKYHATQNIKLLGYNGLETIELAKSYIDTLGNFKLVYEGYNGMGYIETTDKNQLFLVLNEPNIKIFGTHLKEPDSIRYSNSKENQLFYQYVEEHSQREQVLAGWKYILPQYKNAALFQQQNEALKIIQKEINRIEKQDTDFLNKLDQTTYVSLYLPLRKLIDDIPLSAQRYTERIPKHIADFRNINFTNPQLYHSGILDDLIESHYWLIENGGMSMDSMYQQMNVSTDYLINNLEKNDKLINEVSDFLFKLLEKRSLHIASEHLALKLLTQSTCTLEDDLAKQMESYRAMKIGNTAPEIEFKGKKMMMGNEINQALTLNDLSANYTLVVFGSSWCPGCVTEIQKIKTKYINWKLKGLETVFISLDHNEQEFTEFVKYFPFLSTSDFKGWDNQAVKDYYVFATPTLFLLDKERTILLRPISIEQVDAWVNYKIDAKN